MDELKEELEMALGFLRAFLGSDPPENDLNWEDDSFSDLYEGICDTYSAIVDAQIHQYIITKILDNINRKLINV